MNTRFLSGIITAAALSILVSTPAVARENGWQGYPAWLDTAVIYHIYPSSFQDSNGDGVGDLEGIRSRLGYIRETRFNTIWLSPVFCSCFEDGGYDITDYYTIDSRFGTNADMQRLIQEAHSMGMRVCLDLVAGHTSDKHPWFLASASGDPKYRDWYIWSARKPSGKKWVKSHEGRYYLKNYYDIQPALNFGYYKPDPSHPWEQGYDDPGPTAVRQEMKNILAYWFDMGVDGFRCDMAWSLVKGDDKEFHGVRRLWSEIFSWASENYPEAIFLSEWSSPKEAIAAGFDIDIIRHNGVGTTMYRDLVYNTLRDADPESGIYPPYDCWLDLEGKGRFDTFALPFADFLESTRGKGYPCMPTSSHDTWRLNRGSRNTPDQLKVALTFFLTMPWVPIVYYGEEIGMRSMDGVTPTEGSRDRAAQRTPMQWDSSRNAGFSKAKASDLYLPIDKDRNRPTVQAQIKVPSSLYNYVKGLLSLRREVPALGNTGGWRLASAPEQAYPVVYERFSGDELYLVILNPSAQNVTADLGDYTNIRPVYGTTVPARLEGQAEIPGCSAIVCKATRLFTEASALTLVGKLFTDTPNPYHRLDTIKYKGFTARENSQVRESSGIAVAFRTNSTSLRVKTVFGEKENPSNSTSISANGYDLYVLKDGKWLWAASGPRNRKFEDISIVSHLDGEMKECLLYLPLFSELRSVKIGVEEGAALEAIPNPFKYRIAVYGSSFTQGVGTSRSGMAYPAQLSRETGLQMLSLGCSGNCKMQPYFVSALEDVDADCFLFESHRGRNS